MMGDKTIHEKFACDDPISCAKAIKERFVNTHKNTKAGAEFGVQLWADVARSDRHKRNLLDRLIPRVSELQVIPMGLWRKHFGTHGTRFHCFGLRTRRKIRYIQLAVSAWKVRCHFSRERAG